MPSLLLTQQSDISETQSPDPFTHPVDLVIFHHAEIDWDGDGWESWLERLDFIDLKSMVTRLTSVLVTLVTDTVTV